MEERYRIRELGIKIGSGETGPKNAITDVTGVRVGHATLVAGDGPLKAGKGPVRTGVTILFPHEGNIYEEKVRAAVYVLNGAGEIAGAAQVTELGYLESPIAITTTLCVPNVCNAIVDYTASLSPDMGISDNSVIPLVVECDDGWLNDAQGRHVGADAVMEAIRSASSESVKEGAIGAGTGLTSFGFKAGIGTSSRQLDFYGRQITVGVLVASNMGRRDQLVIKGMPVGQLLTGRESTFTNVWKRGADSGSIVIVIATDAPVSERQLRRLAARAPLGVARTGAICMHGSGDFVVAFTTDNTIKTTLPGELISLHTVSDEDLDDFFVAVAEATEEAVLNSLTMATTTVGRDGNCAFSIPIEQLRSIFQVNKNK